ncbi:MAG: aconitase family protein, partial [Dehalococcoidia bacterium]|nr:aconitase family protein [Dehalococcoidia bacterium]
MGKTLAEKILSQKLGRDVSAGEIVVSPVDLAFAQDTTGPLTVREFQSSGFNTLADKRRTMLFLDHAAPSPNAQLSADHVLLRNFARDTGCILSDVGAGVCHQIVAENMARPGDVVVGADSHTVTAGALGAFATGVGSTDVAAAMATGEAWFKVPSAIKINLIGTLPKNVSGKDVILHIIGMIGVDGALYQSLEYSHNTLSMDDRLCMANMAIECGAKNGIFP